MNEVCSLADFRGRPHTTMIDFGEVTVPQLVESYQEYKVSAGPVVQPEELALTFYLMNSAMADLSQKVSSNQPLSPDERAVLDQYYVSMESIGLRCFFYCLLICTRETRHVSANPKMDEACASSKEAYKFWKGIKGSGSEGAVSHLLDHPPKTTIKDYTEFMVNCFQFGGHGSGYAGPAWAAVARPLRDYVHGAITLEMFLDTVWTLAHNNGPIFNKGMLFKTYSGEELVKILDVQRAGMVPSMVVHSDSKFVRPHHLGLVELVKKALPGFGAMPVDWGQVVKLGAVGSYAKSKVAKAQPAAPKQAPKQAPKPDPTWLQIMPGVYVKKISRKEVAA